MWYLMDNVQLSFIEIQPGTQFEYSYKTAGYRQFLTSENRSKNQTELK
ncbi:MAG: hypothetical protein JWR09_2639 [Mucilaginibacter sp.]|nr:hypothetical protein [Mucilaginibacter sp.]